MKLKCSILIVSYNGKQLLDNCIAAIYASTQKYSFEIIVIDNCSSDGSIEMIRKKYPEVLLIENDKNYHFAKANNIGFYKSSGEYILLLNNDTEVQSGAIDGMIEYLEMNKTVSGACGQLLNFDNSIQIGFNIKKIPNFWLIVSELLLFHHFPIIKKYYDSYLCRDLDYAKPQLVEQPAASCMMLRRSVIEKIGLFDETFYYFYNDVDLCLRLKNGGYPLMYLPAVRIYHHQNASAKLIKSKEWAFHFYSNLLQYVKKYYGMPAFLFMKLILLITAFEKTFLLCILFFVYNTRFRKSRIFGNLGSLKDVFSSLSAIIKILFKIV